MPRQAELIVGPLAAKSDAPNWFAEVRYDADFTAYLSNWNALGEAKVDKRYRWLRGSSSEQGAAGMFMFARDVTIDSSATPSLQTTRSQVSSASQ